MDTKEESGPAMMEITSGDIAEGTEGRRELGDGLWIEPFTRALAAALYPVLCEKFPVDDPFFLDNMWLFGSTTTPTALIVLSEEQVAAMPKVNAALAEAKQAPLAVWGPKEFEHYLGDNRVFFGAEQLAVFIHRLLQGAARSVYMVTTRVADLTTLQPLSTNTLLYIFLAREVVKKNVFECNDDELATVHKTMGQVLLAVGNAVGRPLAAAELPKIETAPAIEPDTKPIPGQYL